MIELRCPLPIPPPPTAKPPFTAGFVFEILAKIQLRRCAAISFATGASLMLSWPGLHAQSAALPHYSTVFSALISKYMLSPPKCNTFLAFDMHANDLTQTNISFCTFRILESIQVFLSK
jgi:hypothetical protein